MTHATRIVAAVVLVALVVGAPVQAQTPEIDALRVRAAAGDAEAQFDPGNRYFENVAAAEAVRWFRLAAEQGHTDAQSFLGLVLASAGLGIPRDGTESMYWLRLAAEKGDAGHSSSSDATTNVPTTFLGILPKRCGCIDWRLNRDTVRRCSPSGTCIAAAAVSSKTTCRHICGTNLQPHVSMRLGREVATARQTG